MACLFCFSTNPMSKEDMKGKYGEAFQGVADYENKYDITMCQAPKAETACWCKSLFCPCCAMIHMRHKALNHVEPGSGWSNYKCCQGYFGGCCCLQPGKLGESKCPKACMCLESCLCPGAAVSATSNIIRHEYGLGLDKDDIRLLRCSNCLQVLACAASLLNICIDFDGDDMVVCIINAVADITFCCVQGCMSAQVFHEIELRDKAAPTAEKMERDT
mmetsp:Transcript_19437/g.35308  ORF Transcript_19437/g.35308 Transcript_19437/m.35308 type:complete len:217 (-) Transcript_19437:178-828(-)|eukprot:CAMPEP_0198283250 /NCGR_PEP_ID=MMETSP1449-20131203/2903_1 /TAXON_ID=420275 /ORGANISM="Attheya septentrionalis, Strain CCMP2084" /LENGTH=216 /DNA_ID=CAMNT_0043979817 /DNA_START=95 /DNA_END=745 /DNA_ORIENTATION=-